MSDKLDNIRNRVISCVNCSLSKSRVNAVPGDGDKNSDVIFVGEAPGRNEDLKGKPFVGAAGQILSEALEYAGFERDHVYITNVVKCRPPDNRQPLAEERTACKPYLSEELEIIKPKIICILGNTAYNSLLDGHAIIKNRGKIVKNNGQLYFVTVHPAAVIYNPGLRQVLKDDFVLLAKSLDKLRKGFDVEISQ
ncbi:uracil-DNA glycosylase [Candidatus Nitrosotalea okcheonensis]|uniref:Type-4 uracil-DNA glycosylase n=1 Tax=Candidatus Nitrosotalea okcheonensis TaxID=1903276 RepID=A0A2H1FEA2_9ARCH|nr:uracil-DNA glycosylase [Candidatus Nitrosotalea okcheonensis]MDE1727666.1 uracil-DNA glycosylase [Nitrososphaerota archaeon]MDE1830757.1 uracil-DNA glycosylase [Nitrososphaerota archaeon]MDE1840807.1 uracil-DNA glycosylase [Nitrososphaerota archaeon]MDE1877017.1 uracil-DNA glycosylase [Nitrososphaerota archaeon]SMH71087.1 Uracil-DNA glycosylase, family 4 [Candidatus Nitrosotalea okcheonensis]